jgi:hypothetical protein
MEKSDTKGGGYLDAAELQPMVAVAKISEGAPPTVERAAAPSLDPAPAPAPALSCFSCGQRNKNRARAREAAAIYEKEHALEIAAAKAEETMKQALQDQANALELKKKEMEYPKNWSASCMRAQHSVVAFSLDGSVATTRSG